MISRLVRPIWARSARRRGDADARITLLERRDVRTGSSSGNGGRGFNREFLVVVGV